MLRVRNVFSSFLKIFSVVCIIFVSVPLKAHASVSLGCWVGIALAAVTGFSGCMACCQEYLPDYRRFFNDIKDIEDYEQQRPLLLHQPKASSSTRRINEDDSH